MGEAADGFSDIRSAALSARTAVGAMGAVMAGAGAAALGAAASAASDFEEQMTEVEKVTDPETARKMSDELIRMSQKIPLTTAELADLTAQAGRFGIRGTEKLSEFTEQTAKMANATDLNATEAGEAFARLATLTGMPISEVGSLGSAVNALSNKFATSSSEIVDASLRSAGALRQLGVGRRDIYALSAATNQASESAERAGSRLRRLAQEMLSPSMRARRKLLPALNLTWQEFVKMRNEAPIDMMRRMASMLNEGGAKADKLRQALSTTSEQALAALGSNLSEVTRAQRVANTEWEKATSLQREFEASMDTVNQQGQLVVNQLRAMAITTGDRLLPVIRTLLSGVQDVLAVFQRWNQESNGLAGVIAGVSMVVGGLATAIYGLGPTIVSLTPSLAGLAAGFAMVVGPVAALAAALVAYEQDLYGVQGAVNAVAGSLRSEFIATWQTAERTVLPILSDLADAFLPTESSANSAIAGIVSGLRASLVPAIQSAGQTTRTILQRIGSWWQAHGQTVIASVRSMRAGVVGAFRTLHGGVTAAARRTRAGLRSVWMTIPREGRVIATSAGDAFVDGLGTALDAVRAVVSGKLGAGLAEMRTALGQWEVAADRSMTFIAGTVRSGLGRLQSIVSRQLSRALVPFRDALTQAEVIVQRGMTAVHHAVRGNLSAAASAAGGALATLEQSVRSGFSRVISAVESAGDTIVWHAREAWAALPPSVVLALYDIYDAVVAHLGPIASEWQSHGADIVSTVRTNYRQARTVATRVVARVRGAVETALDTATQFWQDHGSDIVAAVWTNYHRARTLIGSAVTRARDIVETALDMATQFWADHGADIVTSVRTNYRKAKGIATRVLGTVKSVVDRVLGTATQFWKDHGAAIVTAVRTNYRRVRTLATDAVTTVRSKVDTALGLVTSAWETHGDDAKSAVQSGYTTARDTISSILTFLRTDVIKPALTAVDDLWTEHGETITSAVKTAYQKAKGHIETAASAIKTLANGDFQTAFDALLGVVFGVKEDVRTLLVGESGNGGVFVNAITTAGDWLQSNGKAIIDTAFGAITTVVTSTLSGWRIFAVGESGSSGVIGTLIEEAGSLLTNHGKAIVKDGFKTIVDVAKNLLKNLRIFAVGEGGNGGILTTLVTQVGNILSTNGKTLSKEGFGAMADVAKSAFTNLKVSLIGESGNGGLINTMIGQIGTYLKSDSGGKGVVRESFKAMGRAMRAVVVDIHNAIIGEDPSLIGDMIGAIVEYLKTDALDDLKTAAETLFGVIRAAAEGLYEGLIGNSLIKDMVADIAHFFKNAGKDSMKEAAQSFVGGVKDVFSGLETWLIGDNGLMTNLGEGIVKKIGDAVDTVKSTWNDTVPDSMDVSAGFDIPDFQIGGGSFAGRELPSTTIGGGRFSIDESLDFPQLASGGFIEEAGFAQLHAGETVVPAEVDRTRTSSGSVYIRNIEVNNPESGADVVDEMLNAADARLR